MAESRRLVEDLSSRYGGVNPREPEHNRGGNFPDPTPQIVIFTCCGPFRNPKDILKKEWGFMLLAVVTALLMLGFSSHRILTLTESHQPFSSEIVMLLSEVFCLYYICHGVFFERYQEIIIYVIAIIADVIYCSYDFATKRDFTLYPIVRLVLDLSLGCLLPCSIGCWYVRKYYKEPRLVSRTITTEPLQRYYKRLLWFNSLLVIDLQFAICSVIFFWVDRQVDWEDGWVLGVGIVVNVIFCVAGKLAIRFEHLCGTVFFINFGSIHFFFLLFKTIAQRDGIKSGAYLDVASLLFSIVSAVIRVIVLGLSGKVTEKYGQGLKEKLFEDRQPEQPTYGRANDYISM